MYIKVCGIAESSTADPTRPLSTFWCSAQIVQELVTSSVKLLLLILVHFTTSDEAPAASRSRCDKNRHVSESLLPAQPDSRSRDPSCTSTSYSAAKRIAPADPVCAIARAAVRSLTAQRTSGAAAIQLCTFCDDRTRGRSSSSIALGQHTAICTTAMVRVECPATAHI